MKALDTVPQLTAFRLFRDSIFPAMLHGEGSFHELEESQYPFLTPQMLGQLDVSQLLCLPAGYLHTVTPQHLSYISPNALCEWLDCLESEALSHLVKINGRDKTDRPFTIKEMIHKAIPLSQKVVRERTEQETIRYRPLVITQGSVLISQVAYKLGFTGASIDGIDGFKDILCSGGILDHPAQPRIDYHGLLSFLNERFFGEPLSMVPTAYTMEQMMQRTRKSRNDVKTDFASGKIDGFIFPHTLKLGFSRDVIRLVERV